MQEKTESSLITIRLAFPTRVPSRNHNFTKRPMAQLCRTRLVPLIPGGRTGGAILQISGRLLNGHCPHS
jgi:hypothetical protein